MSLKGVEYLAFGDVPDDGSLVLAGYCIGAVVADVDAEDVILAGLIGEGPNDFAGLGVPDLNLAIVPGQHAERAVVVQAAAGNGVLGPVERSHALPRDDIPD